MNENEQKETNEILEDAEMKMPEDPFVSKTEAPHHSFMGPVIGILVILLVLVLAGLYLWSTTLSSSTEKQPMSQEEIVNNEPETPNANADIQALETVSSSDELSAIEADIDNTNLGTLDKEFPAIEAELENAQSVN